MKRILYIPLFAAAALAAASCSTGIDPVEDLNEGGTVCFLPVLGAAEARDAMPCSKASELVSTDGSIAIPLSCLVSDGIAGRSGDGFDLDAGTDPASPGTKGVQFNTTGGWDALGEYADKFYVAAWKSGSPFIPADTEVTKGTGLWETACPYAWGVKDEATFYAYANLPESGASVTATASAQTLEYTVPDTEDAQKDILMGFYQGKGRYDQVLHRGGIAEIKFCHPLTAVRFKKGIFDGFDPEQVNIKSISIKGVFSSGRAVMNPTTMQGEDCGDFFDWIPGGVTKTVTMTPASGLYLTVDDQDFIGDSFLLIPQAITETQAVKISVTADLDGTEKTLVAKITSDSWTAGKTNIYTLGLANKYYAYKFAYSDDSVGKSHSVTDNIDGSSSFSYDIVSTKTEIENPSNVVNPGWKILSYRTEDGGSVPVDDLTFTDESTGLTVTADVSANKINVQASAREVAGVGTHDYWINKDGRTDGLDWSPENWGDGPGGLNKGVIDLSKFNFQTETALSGMTTANCYVIRHAGTYMLPLVYGNAVVNGNPNTDSYAPSSTGLTPFQNHLGQGITSPFIENNDGCDAVEGVVVWQDKAEVIKGLELVDGASVHSSGDYDAGDVRYLKFSIAQEDICQCNAIIAIKDGTGEDAEIIWSWHIWVTNNPGLLSRSISVTNLSGNVCGFFPIYSLGWTDKENYRGRGELTVVLAQNETGRKAELVVSQPELPKKSHGTFYQWGRKDPMCPEDYPAVGSFHKTAGKVSIATAVRTPDTMYCTTNPSGDDWCENTYYNLWTGKRNAKELPEQSDEMVKTIYDPSPTGYKVPAIKAFSGFSKDGNSVTIDAHPTDYMDYFNVTSTEDDYPTLKGWFFYTRPNLPARDSTVPAVFFPALGYRYFMNGEFVLEGQNTGYWSSSTNADISGMGLHFRSGYLLPTNGFSRTFGCSVRPVIDTAMPANPIH